MKEITTALIVLSVMTAGSMVGPFLKTRRSLKPRRCRKVIVIPPPVCPETPLPPPTPEKLKTSKSSKNFIEKLINISIKDLLKTLIMTIVSLVAKVLFEKRTFQTKVIQFVASFLRLIMTIGGYAATDVLSVCILATLKSTFTHLLYKVLLVRSYRIILKHNFKYLLSLGITKMKNSRTETRSWDICSFLRQTLINRFSVILREIMIGCSNVNVKTATRRAELKKQPSELANKLTEFAFNARKKSERFFDNEVSSKKQQKNRSASLEHLKNNERNSTLPKASLPKHALCTRHAFNNLVSSSYQANSNFTNHHFKKSLQS